MDAPVDTPDPHYFQQASMLTLLFRFEGSRKIVASRLMESDDFVAELTAHLPVLERLYGEYRVRSVEVVSYQHGGFYYDPWEGGLALVKAYEGARFGEEEQEQEEQEEEQVVE